MYTEPLTRFAPQVLSILRGSGDRRLVLRSGTGHDQSVVPYRHSIFFTS